MKRILKRAYAVLLCLVVGVIAVPVYAQAERIEVPIEVSIQVEDENLPEKEEIFEVRAASVDGSPLPVPVSFLTTSKFPGEVKEQFVFQFEGVGIYQYEISQSVEKNESSQGRGRYDTTVYQLVITVMNDDQGGLTYSAAVHKGDQKIEDITFVNRYEEIEPTPTPVVTETPKPTVTPKVTPAPKTKGKVGPKTGDDNNVFLWIVLMAAAVAAAAAVFVKRFYKK